MVDSLLAAFRGNFDWLRRDGELSDTLRHALLKELAASCTTDISPSELAELLDALGIRNARYTAELARLIAAARAAAPRQRVPQHVSYLRSLASDRAFRIFSEECEGMSAGYGTNFKSICEDVYTERADACILPLESSEDGLLMSFRTLALKYELSVYAACKVRQNDESVLTLALMTAALEGSGDRTELYIPSAHTGTLEELSELVSALDCRLLRVSTVSSEYSGEYGIHACVQCTDVTQENTCGALKLCLETLYPSYISLGNYKLLNNGKE